MRIGDLLRHLSEIRAIRADMDRRELQLTFVSFSHTVHALTSRERDVLVLLARGLTNRQIAGELRIRPATARRHVKHILAKFGLHTRAQLDAWLAGEPVPADQ